MDSQAARIVLVAVATIGGFVTGMLLEKRIHRAALRISAGSAARAVALLLGVLVLLGLLGVVGFGAGGDLLAAAPTATRLALAVLLFAVMVIWTAFSPAVSATGSGPMTVIKDLEKAGGQPRETTVLGCGGALMAMTVLLGAGIGLAVTILAVP